MIYFSYFGFDGFAFSQHLREVREALLQVSVYLEAGIDFPEEDIELIAAGGLIEGSFMPSSNMPAVADMMRTRGAPIDTALFVRPAAR